MNGNIIVIIVSILICCICIVVNVYSCKDNINIDYIFSLALIIISSSLVSISIVINEVNGVNPLDVYRNKTELQITYKIINNDTVKCDSIVIYKNN